MVCKAWSISMVSIRDLVGLAGYKPKREATSSGEREAGRRWSTIGVANTPIGETK